MGPAFCKASAESSAIKIKGGIFTQRDMDRTDLFTHGGSKSDGVLQIGTHVLGS